MNHLILNSQTECDDTVHDIMMYNIRSGEWAEAMAQSEYKQVMSIRS